MASHGRWSRRALLGLSFAALAGCAGGFYKPVVSKGFRMPPAEGAKESAQREWPYLSAKLHFGDAAFHRPEFRDRRDGDLSHLFVRVSFDHPALGGPKTIPLYLLDLEKGTLDETRGAELISKLPLAPDRRSQYFMSVEIVALEKSKLEIVKKIWDKAKPLVSSALGATGLGAATGLALDTASSLLNDLTASKDFRSTLRVATPQRFTRADGKLHVLYLVLPTDRKMQLMPEHAGQLDRSDLSICELDTGEPYVCVDGKAYEELPYLLVTYEASHYLDDEELLAQEFDPRCATVTAEGVARAQRALDVDARRSAISVEQRVLEQEMVSRARAMLAVRERTGAWEQAVVDPAISNAAARQAAALDAVLDYWMLDPANDEALGSEPIHGRFEARLKALRGCVEREAAKLPVYGALHEPLRRLAGSPPTEDGALGEFLHDLRAIARLDRELETRGLKAVLVGSNALLRANSLLASLEGGLLRERFEPLTNPLMTADKGNEALDQKFTALQELMRGPFDACEPCVQAGAKALTKYVEVSAPTAERTKRLARVQLFSEGVQTTQSLQSQVRVKAWTGAPTEALQADVKRLDELVPLALQDDDAALGELKKVLSKAPKAM